MFSALLSYIFEDAITDRIVDIIYTKLYSDEIKNEATENIVKLFTVPV